MGEIDLRNALDPRHASITNKKITVLLPFQNCVSSSIYLMSSYVPPHLRGGGAPASGEGPGPSDSFRKDNRSYNYDSNRGRGGYGDYGMQRSNSNASISGMSRSASTASISGQVMGRSGSSARLNGDPLEPVFSPWLPSERVQGLSADQVKEIRQRLNVTVEIADGQPPVPAPIESFQEMILHANINADIALHKYQQPTPIQAQGIPIALSGRDILGCAETGSGKTASFSIPMVQHCLNQVAIRPGDGPIGLVLAPTRELAQQIEREVQAFGQSSRLKTSIVVGGVPMNEQRYDLRSGVEIVVATPGRFIDHLQQGNTNLSRVSFIVLDEADRMLDMGFEPQIKEVMSRLPVRRQTLLFSATMPREIEDLANGYLRNPVTVKVGSVSTPTANVSQSLEHASENNKMELLVALLSEEMSASEAGGVPMPLTVVFVERKTKCDEVAAALNEEGIPAVALHGGLGQREREDALREFSAGKVKVLVATDVASRGLDIKGIGHVVNMDLPKSFEDYVHRIGRTGRAGTRGRATSFWTDRDSFLVTQIKTALSELEKGNAFAFATGKEARQAERQLAQEFKNNMKLSTQGVVQSGSSAVKVDDRFSFMAKAAAAPVTGAADAAWDD
ncbi:hypothetical protein CEUSTIGMA_g12161.t1 [Chlamydomonas eustigma]|uniref:RNA helicase n=1 Tax=Chlamydomonas eustigma TaxID=1157962 RepID=A0A250XP69_9CHLO|nr:hypothetical protein CEUSTIGMA_g12161.t1 [Chlamydomonas eustigma]|eukprot:GAX84739.1 hypothetical protein CEUSTIGMA_g12161.t1 [Chlamydomonas eustigma]